jgi:hypothetical protein
MRKQQSPSRALNTAAIPLPTALYRTKIRLPAGSAKSGQVIDSMNVIDLERRV